MASGCGLPLTHTYIYIYISTSCLTDGMSDDDYYVEALFVRHAGVKASDGVRRAPR